MEQDNKTDQPAEITLQAEPEKPAPPVRTKRHTTYYAATAHPAPMRKALLGQWECDVCVVGGGFSGISTALELAEKGLKVIVLEAFFIGYGASGRNGGQVINGYSRDDDTIRSRYGADTANALRDMAFEGGDIIRARVEKYGIDCDLRHGSFFAAFNDGQMETLRRRKKVWEEAGHDSLEIYGKDRVAEVVDTKLYCGGLYDGRGGHIHALNLVRGEADAVEKLGGRIFEQSPVTHIDRSKKRPVVYTDRGRVQAGFVVICGNAYLKDIAPEIEGRIMSVSSQVIATEPLGEELARKMMPAGYCVEDCNFLLDYYRMTADHRLLFGGGVVYTGHAPAQVEKRLWPHVLRTFPYLADKKVEFAWSGNFALTLTRMPQIGRLSDTVYFIQGDSGHGVTTCRLLGRIVAESVTQQAARYDVWASMPHYPFPGGRSFRVPLTILGAWYYGLREKLGI